MASLLAAPYSYFEDSNGVPLAGALIYTYAAGTTTPQASYTDSGGGTPASNPVVADSAGRAQIWLSGTYKIVVKDSLGNTISTTDNVSATSGTSTFIDSAFRVVNATDATKKIALDVSGVTASTTRTYVAPDANGTLVLASNPQTLTNKTYDTAGAGNVFKINGQAISAVSGNTTKAATVTGSPTSGHIATWDASGNLQDGGSRIFTKSYSITGQTISNAGSLTLAHSLGAKPALVITSIVCQTAEFGYSIGDELLVSFGGPYSGTSVSGSGAAITIDATNVNIKFGSSGPLGAMINKSTGGTANLTVGNWTLSVQAYA